MAFNVEERYAAMGAGAAMVVPTAVNFVGIDSMIIDVANRVFEGDRQSARSLVGIGFSVVGAGMVALAIMSTLDDSTGVLAVGLGMGLIGIGAQSILGGGM